MSTVAPQPVSPSRGAYRRLLIRYRLCAVDRLEAPQQFRPHAYGKTVFALSAVDLRFYCDLSVPRDAIVPDRQ